MSQAPNDYEAHPAAKLFPMMGKDEIDELAQDIRLNGQIHPVVMHEGKVLDGRNRIVACGIAGVKPRSTEWGGAGSPTAWVLSVNLKRRHLTQSQKATVATESLPLFEQEAKARQKKAGELKAKVSPTLGEAKGKASEHAAKAVGVSRGYVEDAKAIKEKSPETFEKVKAGEMSIPQAKRQIWDAGAVAERPPEHDPEDDESDGLWQLKQCWRKANKKEKATFLKWIKEHGPKSKTKEII